MHVTEKPAVAIFGGAEIHAGGNLRWEATKNATFSGSILEV